MKYNIKDDPSKSPFGKRVFDKLVLMLESLNLAYKRSITYQDDQ